MVSNSIVSRDSFAVGDFVVYPAHGVGKLVDIEIHDICDTSVELFVIEFAKDHMILKLPIQKACASGLRPICNKDEMQSALGLLGTRSRKKKTMWNRRAQEYEEKINSGSIISLADVIRELHSDQIVDQSYSERQIYQLAMDRFVRELSLVDDVDESTASKKVQEMLSVA
ncbi:MAG: CarD family transcriptional regulator [Holosporales bacterium]|jgi:CarD family transcriptional regulator|nr:CarD family transcriptional regulator [Holosporales bacterium]